MAVTAGLQCLCYTYNHSLVRTQQWARFKLSLMITHDPIFNICLSKLDVMSLRDRPVCPMTIPGCEDIIVESLSLNSLVPILKWSSQPYGSKWVHRQAMHFLCEEFSQVVSSDVLYELGKEHLLGAIQSDYLQVRKHRLSVSGAFS